MLKGKRKSVLIGICLCLAVLLLFICLSQKSQTVPSEVVDLVHTYLETCTAENNSLKAVQYMHFEDEFIRQAYIDAADVLLEYQIQGITEINKSLYEVELLIKSQNNVFRNGDQFKHAWNFVCQIDGKWYYLNGIRHIPQNLRDGLNEEKYVNTNPNAVPVDDVMH